MNPPVTPEQVQTLIAAQYHGHVSLFAKAAGVNRVTLTRFLAGEQIRPFSFEAIARHARAFEDDPPMEYGEDDGAALAALELIHTGLEVLIAWMKRHRVGGDIPA